MKDDCIHSMWQFSNLGNFELKQFFGWKSSFIKDIEVPVSFSLEDSYLGKHVNVSFKRMTVEKSCGLQVCTLCNGKQFIVASMNSSNSFLSQHLRQPCPLCLGAGLVSPSDCSPYKIVDEIVPVQFPRGVTPGYSLSFPTMVGFIIVFLFQFLIVVLFERVTSDMLTKKLFTENSM